jgi:signal transduction histidine kinase
MIVSAAWIGPAVFAALDQIAQRRLHGEPPARLRDLIWAGGDWLVYALITPAVFAIADRWPIVRPHIARRILLHTVVAVLFCALWALGGKLLQLGLALTFAPDQVKAAIASQHGTLWGVVARDVASWIFTTLPFGIVVYLGMAGMAHAFRYFAEARDRDVQMARLAQQVSDAELAALQARLNPHFLFNTLNTIAVRARDGDTAGTARMVEQLSDVLRRTLTRTRAHEVPLRDELDLVRQYLAIEQARFSDRLQLVFDVDAAILDAAVPSFALQHLVENAIRHGIATRSAAGSLHLTARRVGSTIELIVEDDGPGVDTEADAIPSGRGLDNTRSRLRALYGAAGSLELRRGASGGTIAILKVPYHTLAVDRSRDRLPDAEPDTYGGA